MNYSVNIKWYVNDGAGVCVCVRVCVWVCICIMNKFSVLSETSMQPDTGTIYSRNQSTMHAEFRIEHTQHRQPKRSIASLSKPGWRTWFNSAGTSVEWLRLLGGFYDVFIL